MSEFFSRTGSLFRVGGAIAFAVVLVWAAYAADAPNNTANESTQPAVAVVARGDVRNTQETPDTDGDGIPDWEETLLGTDPEKANARPTTTPETIPDEPYTPPQTFTGRFSQAFLEEIIRNGATDGISEEERADIVKRSMNSIAQETSSTLYTQAHINTISDSSQTAIRRYGNQAVSVIGRNAFDREAELQILNNALTTGDPSHLAELDQIAAAYTTIIEELLQVPVPADIAREHLGFVNAIVRLRDDIRGMRQAFNDPLYTFGYIERYQRDTQALLEAILAVKTTLELHDIVYERSEPGIFFFLFQP